jgi:hypothetical protein
VSQPPGLLLFAQRASSPDDAQVIPAMAVSFYTFEEVKKMFPGGKSNGVEK